MAHGASPTPNPDSSGETYPSQGRGVQSAPGSGTHSPGLEGAARTPGAPRGTGIRARGDCADARAKGSRGCPSGRGREPTRGAPPLPLG